MTEFQLIEAFTRSAPAGGEGVVLGIGDDAAVLRPPPGEDLVVTVDAVVEDVHFDASFAARDVGWKALAVNLSDLAAMGARPLWALCALATPAPRPDPSRRARARRLADVGRGLAACARAHGVALAGGNVTRARDLSLTVTVVGAVRRGRALRRAGGRPGDVLLVSGTLGDAAAARSLAGAALSPGDAAALLRRQRRPTPRLALGRAVAPLARAGLDLSDGLLQDLGHLCAASGVGATVHLAHLPLSPAYRRWARSRARPLEAAATGGEDYELLIAVDPARVRGALAAARRAGVALTPVGELTRTQGVRALDAAGRPWRPRTRGHDHLR